MFAAAHRWILTHDDSKVFVVLYIGLAVLLAIFLGLFWLTLVVAIHLFMEMVKQHHYDPRPLPILTRSLWELKLDIGLVLCGLVIGLYIDVIFGLVGVGHVGRAGAQAAARAGMWPRIIRGVLLTLDDVALVAKGAALRKKGDEEETEELGAGEEAMESRAAEASLAATGTLDPSGTGGPPVTASRGEAPKAERVDADMPAGDERERPTGGSALWGNWLAPRWGLGDKISLGFTIANLLLILAAPLLTHFTFTEVWLEILADLHPFPEH